MPERPRPDLDHTREALRKHDERVDDDPAESDSDDAAPDEGDEDEPDTP